MQTADFRLRLHRLHQGLQTFFVRGPHKLFHNSSGARHLT